MNKRSLSKNEIQNLIGSFCIISGGLVILLMALAWPLVPYFAFYLQIPSWGFTIILIGILILIWGKIFQGVAYIKMKQKEWKRSNLKRSIIASVMLIGLSITGLYFIIQELYIIPAYVPLSTFDQTDWEHFNAVDWENDRDGYNTQLMKAWGAFPSAVPLNAKTISIEQLNGYRRIKMEIDVEDSGRHAWDVMPFYMLIPDNPKEDPCPTMIVFHQHDGAYAKGKEEPVGLLRDPRQAFALELVQQGYIAIAPDALCFSERQEISEYKTSKMLLDLGRTLNGKYVWDIARLIDYLVTVPEINDTRIGIMGHSLGGQMSVYCAAYDSRIQVMISNCGIGKIIGENSVLEFDGEENEAFYLPGLAEGENATDCKEILGLIDKPMLISNGVLDLGLPINGVAEIHNWIEEKYSYYGIPSQCVTLRHNAAHGIFPNTKQIIWQFIEDNL
jgi:dienelactone hydrolase